MILAVSYQPEHIFHVFFHIFHVLDEFPLELATLRECCDLSMLSSSTCFLVSSQTLVIKMLTIRDSFSYQIRLNREIAAVNQICQIPSFQMILTSVIWFSIQATAFCFSVPQLSANTSVFIVIGFLCAMV